MRAAVDRVGRFRLGAVGLRKVAVYVTTRSGPGAIVAFDAAGSTGCFGAPKTCGPLFTISMPAPSLGSVAVSVSSTPRRPNNVVVAGYRTATCQPESRVVRTPLWTSARFGTARPVTPPRPCPDGRVFVLAWTGSAGVINEFDANGLAGCSVSPKVCYELWDSGPNVVSAGYLTSPTVANGLVYTTGRAWAPDREPRMQPQDHVRPWRGPPRQAPPPMAPRSPTTRCSSAPPVRPRRSSPTACPDRCHLPELCAPTPVKRRLAGTFRAVYRLS